MSWNDFGENSNTKNGNHPKLHTAGLSFRCMALCLGNPYCRGMLTHIAECSAHTQRTWDLYCNSADQTLVLGIDRINLAKSAILNKTSSLEPSVTLNVDFAYKDCFFFLS